MIEEVSNVIREVVQEKILPHFKKLEAGEIAIKSGPTDFVTIADMEAEKELSTRLKELVPGSVVLGEEVAFRNPDIYDSLCYPDTTIWVVDPLDGTKNFIKGKDVFGVIVSMVKNGETVAGWINIPLHDDLLISGEIGSGAWCKGQKLLLPKNNKALSEMKGTLSIELPDLEEKIKNKLWWGSAAFSYSMLLLGVVDFGIYHTHPLQPWDHAAGVFLHKEAGGYGALLDGSMYRPVPIDGSLILTPDKVTWEVMAKSLHSYMS